MCDSFFNKPPLPRIARAGGDPKPNDPAANNLGERAGVRGLRRREIEAQGWDVIQFSNEDVLGDAEAVAVSIARHLRLALEFQRKTPN